MRWVYIIGVAHALQAQCQGSEVEYWDHLKMVDYHVSISHLQKNIFTDMIQYWYQLNKEKAAQDCAWGFISMTQHVLPDIEKRYGYDRAREQFVVLEKLRKAIVNYERDGWIAETHQSQSYPFLFQLGVEKKYPCEGFSIYIFETKQSSTPIGCSGGMYACEVFFHRWLLNSECRTYDKDAADFFFVPFYAACLSVRDEMTTKEMNQAYLDLLQSDEIAPYYALNEGRDFIWLHSSEVYDFVEWEQYVARSVFLNVEGCPIQCTDTETYDLENPHKFAQKCKHCHWCYQGWKDIMIPGFLEKWTIDHLSRRDKDDRPFVAAYHGADNADMNIYNYANTTVRNTLRTLNYERMSVGNRFNVLSHYFDRIGNSHFCFVPKGLGYWSNRLYEVIFAGCIPVILSDEIRLPFGDFIKWDEVSIKLPTEDFERDPLHYVQMLHFFVEKKSEELQRMRDGLRKFRCWLNYNSLDSECSPYVAISKLLALRKKAFPQFAGKTWGTNLR